MYRKFAKAVHYTFLAGAVCAASLLQGCEDEKKAPTEQIVRSYKGDVEVLNSCGEPGAAAKMRSFLRKNGFDVVSFRNDVLQNYDETIVVLRNPEWEGAQALAATLKTKNVLVLLNKNATVDAIVHTGRDFQQITFLNVKVLNSY